MISLRLSCGMEGTSKGSWTVSTTCKEWASRSVHRGIHGAEIVTDQPQILYLAGSPHINVPWASDGYSPLDLTLLDHHFGTIAEWQAAITEIHRRGMYVVMDNTMST